jgi:hypothetical protein
MTAPWSVRLLTGLGVAAVGLLCLWINSQDPIFGVPLNDPAALVFMALFAFGGLVVAVWPSLWERKQPHGDLPKVARRPDDRRD